MSAHWATSLIGLPWSRGATGPASYDCWGLVRHVQRVRFAREMPALSIGTATNWTGIRAMVNRTAWGPAEGPAREGDVITMKGSDGAHVGVVIEADGVPVMLHCIGTEGSNGGGVIVTALNEIGHMGFGRIETWRHRE